MGKIILRLDRVMADRKMSLKELSERQTLSTKSYFYRDFVVYEIGEKQ